MKRLIGVALLTLGISPPVIALDLSQGTSPGGESFVLPSDIASGFFGDKGQGWDRTLGSDKAWNITIVSKSTGAPVRAGSKAIRFEVRDGDCSSNDRTDDCGSWDGGANGGRRRTQMAAYDGDMGRHGTKEWVAFSLYLPSNWKTMNKLGGVTNLGPDYHYIATDADFESGDDQKYCCDVMLFDTSRGEVVGDSRSHEKIPGITDKGKMLEGYWIENKRWKVKPNNCDHCGHNKQLLSIKELRGHWNDILFHVNWRYDKKGFFKVYANNKLMYVYRGPTTWKHHNTQGLQIGIYNGQMPKKAHKQIAYFDEVRRGKSRAVVTKYLTPIFTYPNGREKLVRGKRYTLRWNKGNAGTAVKIELYRGNKRYRSVIARTRNDGIFTWKVPSSIPKGSKYRLKLTSTKTKSNYDFSDGYFSVK